MKSTKLQRLWNYFLENLDLIILFLTGFVYAILSNLGRIPDPNIVFTIILSMLSLLAFSMIRTRTKFDKTIEKIHRADMFETQEEMYTELESYITNNKVREAILLQYSAQRVNRMVRQLVSQGADVNLFVQSKATAKKHSKTQVLRIEGFPELIKTEFSERLNKKSKGTLVVYDYDPPASLRAVRLDNKILAVGWYIYKYVDHEEKSNYPEDEIKLLGHNQPGKLLYSGTHEYDVMNELFEHLIMNFEKHIKLNGKKPVFEFGENQR